MKEWNSFIITFKKTMIASKGMFTCNIAYIPSNWKDIRIGDMSELYERIGQNIKRIVHNYKRRN